MYKSYYPKAAEIDRQWLLVDANGETLGRLATKLAALLLGKHKPTFTPGVEMGDFVVVINAQNIVVTGTRTHTKLTEKMYHHHSGFPGWLEDDLPARPVEHSSRPRHPCRSVGNVTAQQDGPPSHHPAQDLWRCRTFARRSESEVGCVKEQEYVCAIL